jgi:hypothetical protein
MLSAILTHRTNGSANSKIKAMKKLIVICSLLFLAIDTKAQITLDTIITPWNGFGFDFYSVQMSSTETKYVTQDTITNSFSLYNMDFTPFILNIVLPEPIYQPPNILFNIIYVSRTLFDCDSTNIEYAYSSNGNKPFYIMRTDGTQLFMLDSTIAPYCFGCLSASQDIRPIKNTSAGAKLFLHHPLLGQTIRIYSLCGTLPDNVYDFSNANQSFIKIFPNPTSNSLTFQIDLPDNLNEYELVIVDNNAKALRREKLHLLNNKYSIDVSNFSSGTYFYSLCTKDKTYQSGKFLLNK